MAREIIAAGLHHQAFIERATDGFEAYRAKVESYTLDYAERETGIPAEAIREAAHAFAKADRAMICWTLGITEHHNAVDNVLALISLALLTGHVGRYGSGLNPLRGQNNVQGGGDMGALPDRLPGFQHVENDALRARFDAAWGIPVPPRRGWHLSGMFDAMERGDLQALYVIGENPVQSEADQKRARHLLSTRDFMVVQDIFLTATAELADVVLPAAAAWAESDGTVTNSERRVQRVRKAIDPPGEARDDLAIIFDLARQMGHDWGAPDPEAVWNEVRSLSPVHAGMSYARLESEGGLQWPCYDETHPGELFLHSRLWEDPVPGNRVPFVPVDHDPPVDRLDDDFPIRLTTGRRLDSYNTGVQSGGYTSPAPPRRVARHLAGGRRGPRAGRRRPGPGRVAPRPGRDADPDRSVAPPGPDVHDDALPGRGRGQPPDDRCDRSEVRHRRIQGDRDPDREAGCAGPGLGAGRASRRAASRAAERSVEPGQPRRPGVSRPVRRPPARPTPIHRRRSPPRRGRAGRAWRTGSRCGS